ncbi:hypothetical protein [Microbispora sp. H11081]|nr:hypothetical protein [Microbispora sp. H11081]
MAIDISALDMLPAESAGLGPCRPGTCLFTCITVSCTYTCELTEAG